MTQTHHQFLEYRDADSKNAAMREQVSGIRQQRFAIIVLYSLAVLLVMGYVPGFNL